MNIMGFELDPGAVGALAFVCVCLWLLIYRVRHNAKRREVLATMMPQLGFHAVDQSTTKASLKTLVPDLLFYPNGLSQSGERLKKGGFVDLMPRVPSVWQGRMTSSEVLIMDIEVNRSRASGNSSNRTSGSGSWTVLRWDPGEAPRPPDLLIEERLTLTKNPPRNARAINGPARIGKRYFLFSSGTDDELEPWISTALRNQLAQYRLWKIAAHAGVFYLTMASSVFIEPRYMRQFLCEGEALLSCLIPSQQHLG